MNRTARVTLFAVSAIVAAHLLDSWGWTVLRTDGVYDNDRGRLLRVIGYLPLWWVVAAGIWLESRSRRNALLVALAPVAAGLLAEVLKIVLRRERPRLHDGEYFFRPFSDLPFYTRDIGLPSSHALVAFGGAWMLCRIWPRAWPVWVLLAGGCAVTRVQAGAHFVSDVTVAAVAAYLLVAMIWRRWGGEVSGPVRPASPQGA